MLVSIRKASLSTSMLPSHKATRKVNVNAVENDEKSFLPLIKHFEYLLNLGEVRATRFVATLVDGEQGHSNHEDTVDMTYLPISMGYQMCYKWYMFALGYDVRSKANGAVMVEGIDGRPINPGEFVSFKTYHSMW